MKFIIKLLCFLYIRSLSWWPPRSGWHLTHLGTTFLSWRDNWINYLRFGYHYRRHLVFNIWLLWRHPCVLRWSRILSLSSLLRLLNCFFNLLSRTWFNFGHTKCASFCYDFLLDTLMNYHFLSLYRLTFYVSTAFLIVICIMRLTLLSNLRTNFFGWWAASFLYFTHWSTFVFFNGAEISTIIMTAFLSNLICIWNLRCCMMISLSFDIIFIFIMII